MADLEQRLLAFQVHYERTASPFKWTFTHSDLQALLCYWNLLDDQRFARSVAPEPAQLYAVMVRHPKSEIKIAMHVREVNAGAARREARERLLEAAHRREIDLVLMWRPDRWGRSVTDLLATLQELKHLGVGFVLLTEALDLTTSAGRAMAGLLAIFAEFEREILRERTRAGLAHARQNGQRLGRPATAALPSAEIRKLHRAGVSKSEIARRLQIGRTSVRRILE